MAAAIRSVDLAQFAGGDTRAKSEAAHSFDRGCCETGFLVLAGHGVPDDLTRRAFAMAARFFALPDAAKRAFAPESRDHFNGYFGTGSERTGRLYGSADITHLREKFMISRPVPSTAWDPAHPEIGWPYQPNRWPDLPGFKDVYLELYAAMERVAAQTVRVAAAALGLPETWFDDKFEAHESTMSWMHYPPQPTPPQGNEMRSPAHSDIGAITFLFQDPGVDGRHPGGLQVLGDDGAWRDVDPVAGRIVMNIGDTMRRWTNDRWRSSKHRVANPPRERADTARISLGFFQKPNFAAMLEPVPGAAGPDNPARYPAMRVGEYMRYRMLLSVGQGEYEERVRDPKMTIS